MGDDWAILEREAQYLHRAFFKEPLESGTVAHYVEANLVCLPQVAERTAAMVETIIKRQLDVEAIELALRLFRRRPVLTQKIQILFYIVEVRRSYYNYFVNSGQVRGGAILQLGVAVLRTLWKGIKGAYLVWRYDFA